jgi:hypothetical protein
MQFCMAWVTRSASPPAGCSSLEALLARLDGVLDDLLELGALDCVEDVNHPLAVEAVPAAMVEQVPECVFRRLGKLGYSLDGLGPRSAAPQPP